MKIGVFGDGKGRRVRRAVATSLVRVNGFNSEKWKVRSLIFPTVLHDCETWTMTKRLEKRSTHVRCGYGGRLQRISRAEKRTNESVRVKIGIEEDGRLQQTAIRRKLGILDMLCDHMRSEERRV